MKLIGKILLLFKKLFGAKDSLEALKADKSVADVKKIEPDYISVSIDDLPDDCDVNPKTVYLVGENGNTWLAVLKCPCGCDATVKLNLLPDTSPGWKIKLEGDLISIIPSVERIVGCKSHFSVTSGQISWWPSYSHSEKSDQSSV